MMVAMGLPETDWLSGAVGSAGQSPVFIHRSVSGWAVEASVSHTAFLQSCLSHDPVETLAGVRG